MKITEIVPGTPASLVYPHDTRALVVLKRTPKRVTLARVEVTDPVRVDGGSGDTPPIVESWGKLDEPIAGTEFTVTLYERDNGSVYGNNGNGQRVAFGYSTSRTNYQNW